MKSVIRSTTRGLYKHAVKPLLFRRHPDDVHGDLITLAKITQRIPLVNVMSGIWAYRSPRLRQTLWNMPFDNPLGLAAGLDKNVDMLPTMRRVGFGWMTGGSVTALPCLGNKKPWFQRLPDQQSLIIHAGLPNEGVQRIATRLAGQTGEYPLCISVAKTNIPETADDEGAIADYVAGFRAVKDLPSVRLLELNISCPNTHGGEPFTTPDRLDALLSAIDALELTKPLLIKMPIDKAWPELSGLLDVITRHNVQGVTIGNLRKDRAGLDIHEPAIPGGLSGMPTRDISTQLIRQTYQYYGDKLTIVGVGGIFSSEDAYAKIRAGASLLGMITGLIYEGPQTVGEINAGLAALLERDGLANIADAIGLDAKKSA